MKSYHRLSALILPFLFAFPTAGWAGPGEEVEEELQADINWMTEYVEGFSWNEAIEPVMESYRQWTAFREMVSAHKTETPLRDNPAYQKLSLAPLFEEHEKDGGFQAMGFGFVLVHVLMDAKPEAFERKAVTVALIGGATFATGGAGFQNGGQNALEYLAEHSKYPAVRSAAVTALGVFMPMFGGSHAYLERASQALYGRLFWSEQDAKVKGDLAKLLEKWDPAAIIYGPPSLKRTLRSCKDTLVGYFWLHRHKQNGK